MAADIIIKAGPFFGVNAEPDAVLLQQQAGQMGYPFVRIFRHERWIIVEAWRAQPEGTPEMPSREFVEALIHDEIPNWTSADGYRVPNAPPEMPDRPNPDAHWKETMGVSWQWGRKPT